MIRGRSQSLLVLSLLTLGLLGSLFFATYQPTSANPSLTQGTGDGPALKPNVVTNSSLSIIASETGKVTLSNDAAGTNDPSGTTIRVNKPSAGATVRKAYLFAASTGSTLYHITAADLKLDGVAINPQHEVSSDIQSYNYYTDVTTQVKAKLDPLPAGITTFLIAEGVRTTYIDGEILSVIFDDPVQTATNTAVLLYGAQAVNGDRFHINFGTPINKANPNLNLDMALGISYSYQLFQYSSEQYSTIDVNGQRLTTDAGGQDDGKDFNGALITVGGIGDSNANPPDPLAIPSKTDYNIRYDDELYNLLPFVKTGDTRAEVFTSNPSNDDNVFFASFYAKDLAVTITISTPPETTPTPTPTPTPVSNSAPARIEPPDMVARLRVNPNLEVAPSTADTQSVVTYEIAATNLGYGRTDGYRVELPVDANLEVLSAEFSKTGPWVTKVTSDTLYMDFGPFEPYNPKIEPVIVTGTVRLAVKTTAQPAEILTKVKGFSGWSGSINLVNYSNSVSFAISSSNKSDAATSKDAIQPISSTLDSSKAIVTVSGNLSIPNEVISGWLSLPDGSVKSLGNGITFADTGGLVKLDYILKDLASGNYLLVLYGERSKVQGVAAFTVSATN